MYTVLQIYALTPRVILTDERVDPNALTLILPLGAGDTSHTFTRIVWVVRCTQYVTMHKVGNNSDVHSNASGMRKEQLLSQNVYRMWQGKQWETATITRCAQYCKSTGKREHGCHLKMYTATLQECEKNSCHHKIYTVCGKANSGKQVPSQDVLCCNSTS